MFVGSCSTVIDKLTTTGLNRMVVSRAATIRLPHDTICIAIQLSGYDTYRNTFLARTKS